MLVRVARSASLAWVALAACSAATEYPCNADAQCIDAGVVGVCQSPGWCSFPDAGCDSGQRYGELAAGELAGTCVPVDHDSTGVADDDGSATVATMTTAATSATTATTTEGTSTVSTTTPLTTGIDTSGDVEATSVASATTSVGEESTTTPATTEGGTTGPERICPTYVDDFEAGVIGPEWDVYLADFVHDEDGARVFLLSADDPDDYPWTGLVEPQDLTQGWVRARPGMTPTMIPEQLFLSIAAVDAPDDVLVWFIEDTLLIARLHMPGDTWIDIHETAYDPELHVWLQIRGEGSSAHFEAAGEDEVFETLASYDLPYTLDAVVVAIHAGNYDLLDADTEVSFEHFEVCSP